MSQPTDELWSALQAFTFDQPNAELPFSARLARDNGWSRDYALRVIQEYRRFVYLAMKAGHPVTPSDAVDQAWHLHLCYTRSYWDDLCRDVLGKPLHHGPTKGGAAEGELYWSQYSVTLSSYQAVFGQPPEDIWPHGDVRFGHDLHYRRVNTADHWLLTKPEAWSFDAGMRLTSYLVGAWMAGFGVLAFTRTDGGLFLLLYLASVVVSYSHALWAHGRERERELSRLPQPADLPPLSEIEIAYLCRGRRGLVETGVAACLLRQRPADDGAARSMAEWSNELNNPASEIGAARKEVVLVERPADFPAQQVLGGFWSGETTLRRVLERRGLLSWEWTQTTAGLVKVVPIIGLLRVVVGLVRDQEIGFLTVLCIITFAVGAIARHASTTRTEQGRLFVDRLKKTEPELKALLESSNPGFVEALNAVAIVGMVSNQGELMTTLESELRALEAIGGAGGNDGSGCGGGGCSGGGGGCGGGGCGGGGCGGCGGCGG